MIPETVGAPAFVRAGRLPVGGNGRLGLGVAFAGSAHKAVDRHFVRSTTAFADAGLGPASNVRMSPLATLLAPGDAFPLGSSEDFTSATANHHGLAYETFGPGP